MPCFLFVMHNFEMELRSLLLYTGRLKLSMKYFHLQKELIREVEMGPFKHTLDDGLDIRKVVHFVNCIMIKSLLKCLKIKMFC